VSVACVFLLIATCGVLAHPHKRRGGGGAIQRIVVNTTDAPAAIGPYSQGIRAGSTLYVSGCIGLDPKTGEFVTQEINGQTEQALKNMVAIVTAGGTTMSQVLKTTVLLAKMDDFNAMNAIYARYFPVDPPARSTFQVAALPKGALVEVEAVALIPNAFQYEHDDEPTPEDDDDLSDDAEWDEFKDEEWSN